MMMVKRPLKIALLALLLVIALLFVTVLGYVIYLLVDYSRIPDNMVLSIFGAGTEETVRTGQTYTIFSQNIGFGAYTPDFTFFMDGGKQSWANSRESVIDCVNKAGETAEGFAPDFIFFQEVDTDSTRSYHVNQQTLLETRFAAYSSVFAENYHSSFLMYPFTQPHGASRAGMLTFSRYRMTSALRRSLPISTGVSKFLDLDRCYSVSRVPVEGGKELVLYNVHLSAYGGSPEIRTAQMTMLFEDMKTEYEKGNYTVCGGDFNHDFTGNSQQTLNGKADESFDWAQPFPAELLPDCIRRCTDYTDPSVPTCRNCDVPYEAGNFTIMVDGFLVSENVKTVFVQNIDTAFSYSDHNPVVLEFVLQ